MSSRFAVAITLAVLAFTPSIDSTAETMTLEEYMLGPADPMFAEDAAEENPFEDVGGEPTIVVPAPQPPAGHRPLMFVIFDSLDAGDFSFSVECKPDSTVGSVLRTAVLPHPIDYNVAKIAVHRPRHRIHNDLTIEAEEEILHVEWDAKTGEPTEKSNYQLKPSDRLIVTRPPKAAARQLNLKALAATQHVPQTAPLAFATPIFASPQPAALDGPQAVVYSALPAAVPSPFAGEAGVLVAPTAVAESAIPVAAAGREEPSAIRFEVLVLEDEGDNFAEFEELKSRTPLMLADTATMRGTLRILEKHKLVRRVSAPKLMVVAGETATIEVGAESPDKETPWQGIKAEMSHRKLGGGLAVEFSLARTEGHQANKVQTSLIVPQGQTVVMKTGSQFLKASADEVAANGQAERAVYVVLTPEIVK